MFRKERSPSTSFLSSKNDRDIFRILRPIAPILGNKLREREKIHDRLGRA